MVKFVHGQVCSILQDYGTSNVFDHVYLRGFEHGHEQLEDANVKLRHQAESDEDQMVIFWGVLQGVVDQLDGAFGIFVVAEFEAQNVVEGQIAHAEFDFAGLDVIVDGQVESKVEFVHYFVECSFDFDDVRCAELGALDFGERFAFGYAELDGFVGQLGKRESRLVLSCLVNF